MANVISSATTVANGSIKKNNFVIGVDTSIGYGPTSATTFWNGIIPPTSGYTVYAQKSIGGPSVRVVNNDSELITIAQQYGGTNINTVSDALSYFNSQTNFMVTNIDYPSIVTSGLTLMLDAGYVPSYPRTGTTWNDLSGSNNNGTLTNNPTFSGNNNGTLFFPNIANQSATITSTSSLTPTSITISAWAYLTQYNPLNTFDGQFPNILWKVNTNTDGNGGSYGLSLQTGQFPRFAVSNNLLASSTTFPVGVWVNLVGTYTSGGSQILYRNGVVDVSTTGPASIPYTSQPISVGTRIFNGTYIYPWNGNISNVQIYNRALSATEVLQNYNACKSRFGL